MRDKSAVVIFFSGCPFRCIYCQNYEYLENKNPVELDLVKKHIDHAAEFVDGCLHGRRTNDAERSSKGAFRVFP